MFSFKIHAKNGAWRLIQGVFLFFKETLCEAKASDQHVLKQVYLIVRDTDVQKKQQ